MDHGQRCNALDSVPPNAIQLKVSPDDLKAFVDYALSDFFPMSYALAIVDAAGGDAKELLYDWLRRHRPDLAERLRHIAAVA